jgi:hypothetical protein
MFSKKELEGYLKIDHRLGEGITPQEASQAGRGTIPVGRGMLLETATYRCNHCTRQIVKNPLRERERGYCPKCDHYICDTCEATRLRTGVCKPVAKIIDEFLENAAKGA